MKIKDCFPDSGQWGFGRLKPLREQASDSFSEVVAFHKDPVEVWALEDRIACNETRVIAECGDSHFDCRSGEKSSDGLGRSCIELLGLGIGPRVEPVIPKRVPP